MELTRKTIKNDEAYLRQVSLPVGINDQELKNDIKNLRRLCTEFKIFALAAVQVGIPKRIVYLKSTNLDTSLCETDYDESIVLINPVILSREGHTKYWEACGSCLDNMGLVSRPYKIEIEYLDEFGIQQRTTFEEFVATVVSHELDHLDGILHIDIAEEIFEMPAEERKKFRENHPYQIISKTSKFDAWC